MNNFKLNSIYLEMNNYKSFNIEFLKDGDKNIKTAMIEINRKDEIIITPHKRYVNEKKEYKTMNSNGVESIRKYLKANLLEIIEASIEEVKANRHEATMHEWARKSPEAALKFFKPLRLKVLMG